LRLSSFLGDSAANEEIWLNSTTTFDAYYPHADFSDSRFRVLREKLKAA
jgi:hypothetical protein